MPLINCLQSAEAAIIQLFNEAKRHKPSVMYIPDVNNWYETVGPAVTKLFTGLLRSLPPNDPVLLLGIMEQEGEEDRANEQMMRDLFGYSTKNAFDLDRPAKVRLKADGGFISYQMLIQTLGEP